MHPLRLKSPISSTNPFQSRSTIHRGYARIRFLLHLSVPFRLLTQRNHHTHITPPKPSTLRAPVIHLRWWSRQVHLSPTRPKQKRPVYGAEARNRDALASDPVEAAPTMVSTASGTTMKPNRNEPAAPPDDPKARGKSPKAKITCK